MRIDTFDCVFMSDLRYFGIKIKRNERFKTYFVNIDQMLVYLLHCILKKIMLWAHLCSQMNQRLVNIKY